MTEQIQFNFMSCLPDGYISDTGVLTVSGINVGETGSAGVNNWYTYPFYPAPYDYEKECLKIKLAEAEKHVASLIAVVKYLAKDK